MFCRGYEVEILKLGLVNILNLKFSQDADVWLRFWSWCLVEILKMKFDLCLKLWYELNPQVRCAFGNVNYLSSYSFSIYLSSIPVLRKFELFVQGGARPLGNSDT